MEQQSTFKILPIDYYPQQIEKSFKEITISSKFDSGNIYSVNQQNDDTVINF
jgi:hypothetical protein